MGGFEEEAAPGRQGVAMCGRFQVDPIDAAGAGKVHVPLAVRHGRCRVAGQVLGEECRFAAGCHTIDAHLWINYPPQRALGVCTQVAHDAAALAIELEDDLA